MSKLLKRVTGRSGKIQDSLSVFCAVLIMLLCQITRFGITWTFDRDYNVERFANGDDRVVWRLTLTAIHPASIVTGERTMNGSMVNPSLRLETRHGYDSPMSGTSARPGDFDPSLNTAHHLEIPTYD